MQWPSPCLTLGTGCFKWCYEAQLAGINKPYTYEGWWFGTWILWLSIRLMGCHPSHWLSYYFSRWVKPPTSYEGQGSSGIRRAPNFVGTGLEFTSKVVVIVGPLSYRGDGTGFSVVGIWCWWHMLWLYGFGDQIARGVFCMFMFFPTKFVNGSMMLSHLVGAELWSPVPGQPTVWEPWSKESINENVPWTEKRWKTWVGRRPTPKGFWVLTRRD